MLLRAALPGPSAKGSRGLQAAERGLSHTVLVVLTRSAIGDCLYLFLQTLYCLIQYLSPNVL